MKYSGHRKLLCELSKLLKLNAFILLGYYRNTDVSILVYKFRPERTGFNMYAEYTLTQLTFLALHAWIYTEKEVHTTYFDNTLGHRFQRISDGVLIMETRFKNALCFIRLQCKKCFSTVKLPCMQ